VEYLPAAHRLHAVAPAVDPVSVIDPAPHAVQSAAFVEPLSATYLPASQSMHDEPVDVIEYLPAAHALHAIAPAAVPVSVIDPAPHSMHELVAEVAEYLPAAHAVHVVAAALLPVSVIEPALHGEQYTPAVEL